MNAVKRRWALVAGITITAVVEQDGQPQVKGDWREAAGLFGPGDACVNGQFFKAGSPELEAYLAAQAQGGE